MTLPNNQMEIVAVGMNAFIPAVRFIPAKGYISAWVHVDAILLGRQGTKIALNKISLFVWYQKDHNFLK